MTRSPVDWLKRAAMWLFTGVVCLSGYGLAKLEPFATPVELTLTSFDQAIPFLPWTIWLYGTVTVVSLIAWIQVPDRLAVGRLFFTLMLASAVCWVFFLAWPTTYPRHLFPLPDIDSATIREFADLRAADSPTNCLPSLHVALAWGLALTWAGYLKKPWARPLPIVWAVVVSACTLTTKQHYVIDVPAGFAVGVAAWAVVHRTLRADAPLSRFWTRRDRPLSALDPVPIAKLRAKVEAHQWSLDTIDWPAGPLPPLDPLMVRLINEVTYIEEIAGLNFRLLAEASADEDLQVLYSLFADEERRHADGLRKVLELHGAPIRPPGLGNALVLDQFDTLDPTSDADAALVAVSNPVFETFLDAGTIPFLREHPALQSPAFDEFVARVCRDEAAHMGLNWTMTRERARDLAGWRGLRLLANPSIYRGMIAMPFMSLDVYALAYRAGYDFRTLVPPFKRLWRQHDRYPELGRYPLWWMFRAFCACGLVATTVALALHRAGIFFGAFWTTFTAATDRVAWLLFGRALLRRRGLPEP